jgi:phospholipase/lecithinase/hemolysin
MQSIYCRVFALALFGSLALSGGTAARAAPAAFSELFVFGDSLSDSGNSGLRSAQYLGNPAAVFPPPPYFNGRFSNGLVAVEHLWNLYHPGNPGGLQPSLAGGTNYAIGGSTSGLENNLQVSPSVPGYLQPGYAQYGASWQLQTFMTQAPVFDPANALFVVWLFANDVFYAEQTGQLPGTVPGSPGGGDLISNSIANIVTTVLTLEALGARHILVPNLGDLGVTPAYRGTPAAPLLSSLSATFKLNLAAQLALADQAGPAQIVAFDAAALLAGALANPAAYGFTNVTDACLAAAICTPDGWLFWDDVHLTTQAHAMLAAGMREALQAAEPVPEPPVVVLLSSALAFAPVLGWWKRRGRNRRA